jgi:hypothetical protein
VPRFYFDVWEDETLAQDETGVEFPDFEAARAEALVTLPAIAQACLSRGDHKYLEIRVRDEAGQPLLRVSLALVIEDLGRSQPN